MNTAIIFSSLKYINNNYSDVSKLAEWIYKQLIVNNYHEYKICKILDKHDLAVIKSIVVLIKNSEVSEIIKNYLLFRKSTTEEIVMFLINEKIIEFDYDLCLRFGPNGFKKVMSIIYEKNSWSYDTKSQLLKNAMVVRNKNTMLKNTLQK